MENNEEVIGFSDYDGTPLFLKDVFKGAYIKRRYIKCPHTNKECEWRMDENHKKGYEYLDGACYLSGSFKLQCPE